MSDMQILNCQGNAETSEFNIFWKGTIRVMETESAYRVYERIHTAGSSDTTNMVSHGPFISTNHLIKCTIILLENNGLKQEEDFKIPLKSWVEMQFTSNNG